MRSVLHVGNIAHNAYFNELILRKMGRSGCVVHHDAYHFASCPQWLNLSDQGIDRESLGDDFFPNFFQFKKSEELAPDFFFQGPSYQVFGCLYSLCTNKFDVQKIVYIPHGFDDNSCTNFLNGFKKSKRKKDIIKFFAPARHDWVNGDDGNSKGNEIIVKAAKKLVEGGKTNFLVTMLEYGSDVQATKNLIQQLDLETYFEWKPTMTREELWSFYLNSDAVLDQFYIPAIGQIGVESLALGSRLINADNGSITKFFGYKSPILAATHLKN